MDHNDHSVYLTFDDGPIPESTPFILQTLKEFGIHATFFMVGDNVEHILGKATVKLGAYTEKVSDALKPQVKLSLLRK